MSSIRLRKVGKGCYFNNGTSTGKEAIKESIALVDYGFVLSDIAFAGSDVLATSYALLKL